MPLVRRIRSLVGIALVALLALANASSLGAQTTSGSVSGTVQDAQGGVLPGVSVTLSSRTQGTSQTTVTDGEGRFVFPVVRPDTYSLQFALEGFKTLERTNLVVSPSDRIAITDLRLEVGAMSEEVTVTSRVSELQITSGERSFTLESEALKNIANNGRSLFNFASLVPGVLQQGTGGSEVGAADGFTVNGQRQNSNNVTIDGVANIDTGNNGGNMASTNIDAVAEFKILTNGYQAEYGRAVGGQVQVVTKSGTQAFHGSGYWYGRRSDWNANSWTNNRAGIQPAKASRNDYGYTIGGPVFIPGLFNEEKKKLFFFFSQEHQKRADPVSERLSRVPTALERSGDFSQSVDNNGNPWPYIRDYTLGLPCNASNTAGCFAAGGVLGRIPADRLYAPGLAGLNIYPMPNTSRGSGINYASQAPTDNPRREDLVRLDFQATDNWRVTGRMMKTKNDQTQPYGTTWAGAGSNNLDTINTLFETPGSNYMVSAVGVLNSTTSLELSWGRAHNSLDFSIQNENLRRSAAGLSSIPLLYPDAVQQDYIPDLRFNGGRVGGSAGFFQTDRGPFTNENTTHDVIANLTKVWGAHTSKVGVYYQNSYKPQSIFSSFNSQINFIDSGNNPFDSGFGYANAALGVFNTYTQASKYALPEWRYHNFEWYLQDNWKMKKLTLDYGVRFYYLTPQWDETLQASNFLPDQYDPSKAVRLYRPALVNGVTVGVDPANPSNVVNGRFIGRIVPGSGDRFNGAFQAGQGINDELQDGSTFKVSPRFGFTYDLTGQAATIVRGGFGIFYDRPQGNMVFDMIANAPGVVVSTLQWGRLQDLSAAQGDPDAVVSLNPTVYDFEPPKVYQWNVGVQHKLWRNYIFDIAYVGSESKDLLRQVQINALPFGATFRPENQDPTRPAGAVPGSSALPTNLLRPYKGYGGIRMWDYSGYSNYHALQTGVNRRYENGLLFSVFYVWSKALGINSDDFSAGVPNQTEEETKRLDYSYVGHDRPHNFVVNFIYQLPKLTDNTALGFVANDWQLSGIYRWTSGRPYGIGFSIPGIGATNLTGTDTPNARVALTCDPGKGYSGDPYQQIGNVSCFAPPQPGSDGNESARFFMRAPPINNVDLSISKVVQFGKGVKAEVRLDMFNALNHTQFTGVNSTVNFRSLTDHTITNLPYNAAGQLVNQNGFGTINGVAPPRTLQLVTRLTF